MMAEYIERRVNNAMADLVNHALDICEIYGAEVASRYMHDNGVPDPVIIRVLDRGVHRER